MYTLKDVQYLSTDIQTAWNFFSNPSNLSIITPKEMNFVIKSDVPEKMYPGLFIHYRVSPFPFLTVPWTTEITIVNEHHMFVDEQRRGPYQIWHHEHHFEITDDGVRMTDILNYHLPLGFIGKIVDYLIVRRKVKSIFDYRRKAIENIFPPSKKTH